MNTQLCDAGGQNASTRPAQAEGASMWEQLLPAEPELTPEQETEAALAYLESDRSGSAHLVPPITDRLTAGADDERMLRVVLDHLSGCEWCRRMLRDALQFNGSPAEYPAYHILETSENWINQTRRTLDSFRDIPEGWDGYGAEAPNEAALSGAYCILKVLERLDTRPSRVAPSAEGGVTFAFFAGTLYGDIEAFNSGEILAVTSDGSGDPQIWQVAAEEEAISAAVQRINVALRGPATQAPKPELTEKQKGLLALLDTWAEEDKTDDPQELDRRDQELREFKKNMNKWRAEEGRGPAYT